MKANITAMTLFLIGCASMTPVAAQSTLPSNVPTPGGNTGAPPTGVSVVYPPPAGFNLLTASPTALAQYNIPPAPSATDAPKAYTKWLKAVAGPHKYVTPLLTQTNISNGPVRLVGPLNAPETPDNSIVKTSSSNWSGTAVVNSLNPFKVEAIVGEFVVPGAHQAFGSCTGGWDYSSQWPGIDGFGSNDVLQAGVEVDAYCNGGSLASFYSAWIEWYPFSETRVSSPAINPGDLIFIEVWNTSSTTGFAYFYNLSTEETAEYSLTAPSGTTLVGNSAEWIVERPGVNGGLATLTNYIDVAWDYGYAWNYTAKKPTYFYDGKNPPAPNILYEITMLDNNGAGISSPTVENADFLWFLDYGSACGRTTGYPSAPPC